MPWRKGNPPSYKIAGPFVVYAVEKDDPVGKGGSGQVGGGPGQGGSWAFTDMNVQMVV
jgi:hypothetical protein